MGVHIEDFYNYIIKQLNRQKVSQFVYFHNVSFDGTFILYYLNSIGVRYETVINNMKRIYEIKVFPSKAKRHISFRCTYLIFMCSVASLPHSTKSIIDYELIRNYKTLEEVPEKEKYYIKQDVITVKRNLKDVRDIFGIKLTGFFKTIASISYKDLRKTTDSFLRTKNRAWIWYFPKLSIEMDNYIRGAYRGGVTYLNPYFKGKLITEEVGSWDEVSEYPSVMKFEYMPAGKPYFSDYKPTNNRLYIVRIRVLHAKIKEGLHPFINPNKTLRYLNDIYPEELNEVVLTLTNIDYELYQKYYESVHDEIDYCIFPRKIKGAFNNYIDKWYKVKEDAKKTIKRLKALTTPLDELEKEELKRAIFNKFWAKLKLNSPYGKFGTNPLLISAIPIFTDGMLGWEEVEELKEVNKYYLPVACFITSYARRNLINQIQANSKRFIYCDTDSLHLLGTQTPKSLKGLIGSNLGQWEYEGTSYKSKFIKPKQYLKLKEEKGELVIKRTIASLNKSQHHRINFDNFESGITIPNGKRISKNVKGGRIIKPLDFTFK